MVKPVTLSAELRVRDVMTSPVIECDENDSSVVVADKMRKYGVGSVVVTKNGEPRGIITKTDLVCDVVANGLDPNQVLAKNIMTTSLQTIEPDATIDEAITKMNRLKISRLVVVYKGRVAGIVSVKDILQVTPEIVNIVREKMRLTGTASTPTSSPVEGYCDVCGEWSDLLTRVEDQLMCEECRLELEESRKE
ncbi:Hypoxic response protein 1 [archaeon HR01]|nr:Hypoxic response protein 1 [archaeon HR01]